MQLKEGSVRTLYGPLVGAALVLTGALASRRADTSHVPVYPTLAANPDLVRGGP
jgi:hypothetical protein